MKKYFLGFIVLISVLLLAACGQEEAYEAEPIDEEVDTCAVCNMMVPDNQHATQIILADGKVLKFDDIGCMANWNEENSDEEIGAEFVRDYHTEEWFETEDATFVYDQQIMTPMAYNVISFQNEEDAQSFIEEEGYGESMSKDDLENHPWERNMEMMEEMKANMNHDHDHDHEDEEM
ncbi:lipoprotein [Compostibacillus humi]|uniref:Lipoprotein n=1 Tax=Compostibacillus humi TaxID=1245525 RepID=A0A8J2XH71_9BACI|nr:nitrous oxide reductase accessory protein NosL [Compostibacillus humi]GFZ87058.1 lipoprotein [Compostibacillus humi]